jgi:hypothetical protein
MEVAMYCGAICSHGGMCDLEKGHLEFHSATGYCEWEGESGVSREEADDMIRISGAKMGLPGSWVEGVINGSWNELEDAEDD